MVDIDEIYDAAFDRERFEPLLRRILTAMNAQAGFIGWVDMARQARFEVQFGNDPGYLQSYAETYAQHDILQPTLQAAPEGVVMQAYAHLQTPEVRDSRFYREWLAPQRIVDNLAVNLIKRERMFAPMAILRMGDAPPFDAEDLAKLQAIVPHLKRAIHMQSRLVHQANLVGGYQRIASGGNGLVLLDDRSRVLDVDRRTQALTGLQTDQALGGSAFEKALLSTVRDGAPVAVEVTPPDAESLTLLCVAQPLERDGFGDFAGGLGGTGVVASAVHVLRIDQPATIAFASMADRYGLTPTEVRVMADAFAHADLTELGDRLGMARATARTHLHRIYDKTGVQGFAGLALLAHRFAVPTA